MDPNSILEHLRQLRLSLQQAGKSPSDKIRAVLELSALTTEAKLTAVWHRDHGKALIDYAYFMDAGHSEQEFQDLLCHEGENPGSAILESHLDGADGKPYVYSVVKSRSQEPDSGQQAWFSLSAILIEILMQGADADIEGALQESQTRYQALLEANPDLMFLFSEEGVYLDYRVVDRSMMVAPPEEMLGKSVYDLLPRHLADKTLEAIEHVKRTGGSYIYEYELPLDKHQYFESRFVPCGKDRYLSIIRDVTQQKLAAIKLSESEERYRRIYETANEGIMAFDAKHHITQVNLKICKMLGYTSDELIGQDPRVLLFEDDLPEHEKKLAQRRLGEHDVYERRFRRKDGSTLWTLVSATSLVNERGEFIGSFSMFQDISTRKAIELKMTDSIARYALQRNCMTYISVSPLIRDGDVQAISEEITELGAKALEVERVNVWLFDPTGTKLQCIDLYESSPNRHSRGYELNSAEYIPELSYLKSAKYVDTDDPCNDPRTQGYGDTYLKPNHITSLLDVVIRSAGKDFGLICFEHVNQAHRWQEDEISFACQLADQIALTLGNRDRRLTENALRDSEERYRLLLEIAPIGIAVHSEGRVVFTNPSGARIAGYDTPQELIGTNIADHVHSRSHEYAFERLARLLKGEKGLYPTEYYFRKKDGSPTPVEVTATLMTYNNRPAVLIIFSDIAQRKKAEEEIRRNVERLTSIASILQYRTDSVQEFLDFALQETVRLTDSSIGFIMENAPASDGSFSMTSVYQNGARSERYDEFKLHLSNDGIWVKTMRKGKPVIINDYANSPLANLNLPSWHDKIENVISVPVHSDGKITAVVGVANKAQPYDNTDVLQVTLLMDSVWKTVENRQNQEQIRKLSRAVEQSPVSIIITDTQGRIEYVNDFFTRISGFSAAYAVGKNPNILKSGAISGSVYQELWATITNGRTWTGELLNRKANGELYWESASITPVTDSEGRIINYLGVKEDITMQKRMTQELIQARDQAEETTRLKSNFLANMSHELRTPLVGIMGYSELLSNLITDPEQQEMVMMINTSGKRLLHTLNMILDLSRIEANSQVIRFSTFELNSFIKDKVTLFKAAARKKKLSLNFMPMTEPLHLHSDPHLLEHVVNDLINNAIKFTDKGSINVYVELLQEIDGCQAVIRVKDTGIGIPEDRLQVIFDGFRQVSEGYNRNFGGSGLGLTISKKYTELLGGTITVNSILNEGSTFTIFFPEAYIRPTEAQQS